MRQILSPGAALAPRLAAAAGTAAGFPSKRSRRDSAAIAPILDAPTARKTGNRPIGEGMAQEFPRHAGATWTEWVNPDAAESFAI